MADRERHELALFSYENLYRHYLSCRSNKRNTVNALRFEAQQERNLLALCEALETRAYRPAPSVCFVTKRPKLREIFAADFRDRVAHHVLVDYLEQYWERVFIHDSYACRTGKGVHGGGAAAGLHPPGHRECPAPRLVPAARHPQRLHAHR